MSLFVQRERNQQLHKFKKLRHSLIEDLLYCATAFLFFISIKLNTFCVTQNETPNI